MHFTSISQVSEPRYGRYGARPRTGEPRLCPGTPPPLARPHLHRLPTAAQAVPPPLTYTYAYIHTYIYIHKGAHPPPAWSIPLGRLRYVAGDVAAHPPHTIPSSLRRKRT
ncbi:hypothetical protein Hanom_Chr17g01584201 [Helianthus anomalus]